MVLFFHDPPERIVLHFFPIVPFVITEMDPLHFQSFLVEFHHLHRIGVGFVFSVIPRTVQFYNAFDSVLPNELRRVIVHRLLTKTSQWQKNERYVEKCFDA